MSTSQVVRDAVTGAPISSETQFIIKVRDQGVRIDSAVTRQDAADGFAANVSVVPSRLHTQQECSDGISGAKQWSPAFRRYIGDLVPTSIVEADREIREWWHDDYARKRLTEGFLRRYGSEQGARALAIALAALRTPKSRWGEIAEQTGKPMSYIVRQRAFAYEIAFPQQTRQGRAG